MKHLHRWIKSLIDNLDAHVDEKTRVKVLENCGRTCISRDLIKKAQACKNSAKDIEEFLDKLSQIWSHLQRDDDEIHVVYEKCYCPLVKAYPEKLSPTFCNCSRGWIKELFESVLERPVDVEIEKSIRQGDDVCKFRVLL
jgi:predicted hydrocarbon binding protein